MELSVTALTLTRSPLCYTAYRNCNSTANGFVEVNYSSVNGEAAEMFPSSFTRQTPRRGFDPADEAPGIARLSKCVILSRRTRYGTWRALSFLLYFLRSCLTRNHQSCRLWKLEIKIQPLVSKVGPSIHLDVRLFASHVQSLASTNA